MKCDNCNTSYTKGDAVNEFERRMDGLSYTSEIDGKLCGDCAVDFMENKIRSQLGYAEYYAESGEEEPRWS